MYLAQYEVTPAQLGLNAVTIASQKTSNIIGATGVEQIAVEVDLLTQTAATRIDVNVEARLSSNAGWSNVGAASTAATGVSTLTDLQQQRAVAAVDTFVFNLSMNYKDIRVKVVGQNATTDTCSVRLFLTKRKAR